MRSTDVPEVLRLSACGDGPAVYPKMFSRRLAQGDGISLLATRYIARSLTHSPSLVPSYQWPIVPDPLPETPELAAEGERLNLVGALE